MLRPVPIVPVVQPLCSVQDVNLPQRHSQHLGSGVQGSMVQSNTKGRSKRLIPKTGERGASTFREFSKRRNELCSVKVWGRANEGRNGRKIWPVKLGRIRDEVRKMGIKSAPEGRRQRSEMSWSTSCEKGCVVDSSSGR
jgi:hypothetical protein